jgi:hypothetical protein
MNERLGGRFRSIDDAIEFAKHKNGFGVPHPNVKDFVIFRIALEEPSKHLLGADDAHAGTTLIHSIADGSNFSKAFASLFAAPCVPYSFAVRRNDDIECPV